MYAGDNHGRLIALALVTGGQGRYSYLLECNGETGSGFVCAASLLEGLAARLTEEYLDGQFRCMPNLAKADVFDLTAGPHLDIKLQGR